MGAGFQVRLDQAEIYPVLHISGEITSEAEVVLVDAYQKIAIDQRALVIMDFAESDYINSSGIAVLIQLITESSEKKQKIVFASLSPHFQKIMDIVGLTGFVKVHATLAEAQQG